MTYLLRLSQEHARAVSAALNLYQRCCMGDYHEIGNVFEGKNGDWKTQREQGLDEVLDRLKKILAPDLNPGGHNYGYGSEKTGKMGHLAYEVKTALDFRRAWTERPLEQGEYGDNDHYEPILFPSSVTPKPECATEDGEQPELAHTAWKIAREIEAELGTNNIKEALEIIKKLKEKACQNHDTANGASTNSSGKKAKHSTTSKDVSTAAGSATRKTRSIR